MAICQTTPSDDRIRWIIPINPAFVDRLKRI